jgi:pyridoxine/pyridoxamine 5'-phosphate oxidase
MDRTAEIREFLASKHLMTISTVNQEGQPEAAVVGFGETEQLQIVFGTSSESRKYHNLQKNERVAVAIGWDDTRTVQYEGVAKEITGPEVAPLASLYFAKNPHAAKYRDLPTQRYFLIEPTWIRYTDIGESPWDVI